MRFKTREEVLSKLVDETLTDQEIKRLGLTVSSAEVDSMLERIKEVNYLTDEELRAGGVGPEMIRLSIGLETTEDLLWDLDQALSAISA